LKILFTSPTYYPFRGGAESCIEDLASRFVEKGHNVTVVTGQYLSSLAQHETRKGVSVVRLPYPSQNPEKSVRTVSRLMVSLIRLSNVIRKRRVDVVCVGLVGLDTFLILLLHYVLKFKLVVYLHGGELRSYVRISFLIRWTLKHCLRRCYAAIAVSEQLKVEATAFEPAVRDKIFVIPNGVDIEMIKKQPSYQSPRDYLLFLGRLDPVKDIETLIEAFGRISASAPELDLMVAGNGSREAKLKAEVLQRGLANRIVFLGDQERSDAYALVKGSRLLVLPSFSEGCPVVLLEALAAGKIAIASNVKGTSEIIQHEVNGLLFEQGDAVELANVLIEYQRDDEKRRRLEDSIQKRDLSEFDIDKTCEQHLNIYRGRRPALKICVISDFYYQDPDCCGLSTYYFNLVESLSSLGHDVYLITSSKETDSCPAKILAIESHSSFGSNGGPKPSGGFRRVWARFVFSWRAYLEVRRLERSSRVDVIIAPELFAPALVIGLLNNKKLITRLHTPTYLADRFNASQQSNLKGLKGIALSIPEWIQSKRSRGLSVASEQLRSAIANDWRIRRSHIELIPNSVRVDLVRSIAAEQEREIPGEYLLYFGRLEERKGVHIISRALPRVFAARPGLKMAFIGRDWGLKEKIIQENRRHSSRLVFFDTLEKDRLFGAIRFARLILLPSLFENLSLAGLEAMALEKPVIGTYATAFEEIIEDGVNGFLVQPSDPQALAAKILSCLESEQLEQVGKNAYQTVRRFDSEQIAQKKIDFYRSTLKLMNS
jgi:glycosyltransferase involved in cell wall biosynthesis